MSRTPSPLPPAVSRAARRLDAWRRRRTKRVVPAELWDLAAELAVRFGVSRVSGALRLDYYELKRRAEARSAPGAERSATPGFIEIVPARPEATECRVEIEDGRGAKMKVMWMARGAPDLEGLSRGFLGRKA